MRNIIKKISISVIIMALISGIFITGKCENVYAEGDFTVNFHYTRSDANYAGYTIKAYSTSDSNGQMGNFTVNDKEGTFSYTFARNVELDDTVFFIIQSASPVETELDSSIAISGVTGNVVDVAINGDSKTVSVMEAQSAGEDTAKTEAQTEKPVQIKADDPNGDYSVSTTMVIVVDVVFLIIIAIVSFLLFGKEKKEKI